jgi:hypothetical protein
LSLPAISVGFHLWVGLSLLAFFSCQKQLKSAQTYRSIPNATIIHQSKFQLTFLSVRKNHHFTHISKLKNPTLSRIQPKQNNFQEALAVFFSKLQKFVSMLIFNLYYILNYCYPIKFRKTYRLPLEKSAQARWGFDH